MYTMPNEIGLHGILGRKDRARGALQIGRKQRSQEMKIICLLATALVSGELKPEDGSSSALCSLLLQGDQVFHIFCK